MKRYVLIVAAIVGGAAIAIPLLLLHPEAVRVLDNDPSTGIVDAVIFVECIAAIVFCACQAAYLADRLLRVGITSRREARLWQTITTVPLGFIAPMAGLWLIIDGSQWKGLFHLSLAVVVWVNLIRLNRTINRTIKGSNASGETP